MVFKENSLVRHTRMPAWGIGRVLKIEDEVIWIEFSAGGLKKLKADIAAEHLAPAEIAAPQASARAEASRSQPVANLGSRSRGDAKCAHCDQLLKRSQHRNDGSMKSCPNCSGFEGEHIFYPYPEAFGAQVTAKDPGRDQSDCSACRANESLPHAGGTPCSQIG